MARPSPIAAQPQFALNAAHVKALGKGIVRSERHCGDGDRGNGYRATGRLLLAQGLPPIPFRLIPIVQAEMGIELGRTETKAESVGQTPDGHDLDDRRVRSLCDHKPNCTASRSNGVNIDTSTTSPEVPIPQ